MKKSLFLIFALLLAWSVNFAQDCPFGGNVDCVHGCGLFEDKDGDGFCDHGKLSKPKEEPVQTPKRATDKKNESSEDQLGKSVNTPETGNETPVEVEEDDSTDNVETGDGTSIKAMPEQASSPKPYRSPYHVYSILIGTLLLYIASVICVKDGLYSKATHRKIWNVLLTITFLVSCLLGLLLAIFLFHGYRPEAYLTFLKLHVWFGIAMTLIALFHAAWHWNYFKTLFKKKN